MFRYCRINLLRNLKSFVRISTSPILSYFSLLRKEGYTAEVDSCASTPMRERKSEGEKELLTALLNLGKSAKTLYFYLCWFYFLASLKWVDDYLVGIQCPPPVRKLLWDPLYGSKEDRAEPNGPPKANNAENCSPNEDETSLNDCERR